MSRHASILPGLAPIPVDSTGGVSVIRESRWPARRDMMDPVRVWTRPAVG